jgi:hypothetical protein
MLIFVESTLGEAEIPEISETEEGKALLLGQLKHDCLKFAKKIFQGKIFVNKDTGKPIRVSQDGLMEWWRKSRKRDHVVSIKLLNFFLENAVFQGEVPDYKNRREIESVSRFETCCKVNGKPYKVVITTRKAVDDIDKLRYYTLKDTEIAEPVSKLGVLGTASAEK